MVGLVGPLLATFICRRQSIVPASVQGKQLIVWSSHGARGAIVDAPQSLQAVVLAAAAQVDDVDIVKMLLDLGFDADVELWVHGSYFEPAMHLAIRNGAPETVGLLLRHGFDANARSKLGDTPLALAAECGRGHLFELVLASGAMIELAIDEPADLLYLAINNNDNLDVIVPTVLRLVPGIDVNACFKDGPTPLSFASLHGNDKAVKHLLAQGADPNAEARRQERDYPYAVKEGFWQALHAAASVGSVKAVELLLQHGADVNARTESGDTPLSLALEWQRDCPSPWRLDDCKDNVQFLLSQGAVIDERSSLLMEELVIRGGTPE